MNPVKRSLYNVASYFFNKLPDPIIQSTVSKYGKAAKFLGSNKKVVLDLDTPLYGKVKLPINSDYRIDRIIINSGHYDLKTVLYFKRLVSPGDNCIDIGANIGSMTMPLVHMCKPAGKVFAFEPGPILYERLKEFTKLNNLESRINVYNYGLSDKDGTLRWSFDKDNPGNALFSEDGEIEVAVKTLDDLDFLFEQKIDFVKIDVEGMELEVIKGGMKLLSKNLPTLLYETERIHHDKTEEIQKVLADMGYEFFEIDVPYLQLNVNSDFNFIPTSYPELPQNTLAVHSTKLDILKRR